VAAGSAAEAGGVQLLPNADQSRENKALPEENRSDVPEKSVDQTPQDPAPASVPHTEELPPGAALWKYVDVAGKEDLHPDTDPRHFDAPPGWRLIGARIRGRKHKHARAPIPQTV
jgi:hypothetical protein